MTSASTPPASLAAVLAGRVAPGEVVRTAPAKLNLALAVTGRRADGYHELDSLVAFAAPADGDRVAVRFGPAGTDGPSLTLDGPFAGEVPGGRDNLVLAAARAVGGIAHVTLRKGLPVAAGLGGGSADAAAVLQAAAAASGIARAALRRTALALGADVPVCLTGRPCRMGGIGERLTPVDLPGLPAVLVNPGRGLETREVFARLIRRANPPLPPLPPGIDVTALTQWLALTRNDLEAPALSLLPEIGEVLRAVRAQPGCVLARMSGSGASVFGLFGDARTRAAATAALEREGARHRPAWWVRAADIAGSAAPPQADAALG